MQLVNKPEKLYSGVIVPMVTPFREDLSIDVDSIEKILEGFMDSEVSPFLLGTTGESVSISDSQKVLFVSSVLKFINGRAKVYAGISGNSIHESIENAKIYSDLGVDAVVAHLPFYYPLSSDQMLKYYEYLAEKIPCPLILYNNPITVKQSIPLEIISKLSYHDKIVGIKDSERGMERLDQSLELYSHRTDFVYLLGWTSQSAYALQKGADGIIPSTGNFVPKIYKDLYNAAIQGDPVTAFDLQVKLEQVSDIYIKNKNISQAIPALKVMMSVYGLCKPVVMPPLTSLIEQEQAQVKDLMVGKMGELFQRNGSHKYDTK